MEEKSKREFKVGEKASLKITFSEEEVAKFSKLCRDKNPVHVDEAYAQNTRFKKRIVQGAYLAALIPGILGSDLPGPGTIYMEQNTKFLAPVFIGDSVTANVEIIKIREDKPILTFRTWVEKDETIVLDGEATVLYLGS